MEPRALVQALTGEGERARFVRMVRPRVASEPDAEDVVQRALSRAIEHAAAVDDPARARAWFYRILRRTITDHHRARRRDAARLAGGPDPDDLAGAPADPHEAA